MLKFVLFGILVYLLLRAVVNLARAMRRGGRPGSASSNGQRRRSRFRRERRSGGQQRGRQQRREQGERATRLRDEEEDVEDARWEDL